MAIKEFRYKEEKNQEYLEKCSEILKTLPAVCTTFIREPARTKSALTRYTYARRFSVFFRYLSSEPGFGGKDAAGFGPDDLGRVTQHTVYGFINALKDGSLTDGKLHSEVSVNNYLSALSSLWKYMASEGIVPANVISGISRAKKEEKEVIYLDGSQSRAVLNTVTGGVGLTGHAADYRTDASAARDAAIYTLLLHTGIRVSELVGLDLQHLFLEAGDPFIRVIRKRKNEEGQNVYISDEAKEALGTYLALRADFSPLPSEQAVFLVSIGKYKGTRMSVRSVERMVKKYASCGAPEIGSSITPHKLRASYATAMIRRTNDLSLVQNMMAHKSPATTSIYIADRQEERMEHRNDMQDNG